MKLNLGSGQWPMKGWVNIDVYTDPKVDLVHDLNNGIPFEDGTAEAVVMSNVLDHLRDPLFIMREIRRVCRPGALVEIRTPLLQHKQPDHYTCFYEDWFERNCSEGWRVLEKTFDTHQNIWGEDYTSMRVKLERI